MTNRQPPAFQQQTRRGLARRTPPAIFPPLMGLLGLVLGWRQATGIIGQGDGVAELLAGAISLLYLFALAAYLRKLAWRPAVVAEDLRTLPGRAGLVAANMSGMLLAAVLVPYVPGLALILVVVTLVIQAVLGLVVLTTWFRGPTEARVINPVWHLTFVGYIVAGLALVPLGHPGAALAILVATIPVAAMIWAVSLWQLLRRPPPAPLRPLLAIHLAPAALFASVAALLGLALPAVGFSVAVMGLLLVLVGAGRWITAAGFSALWGAFTFPLAAAANALMATGWQAAGLVLLVLTTAVVVPIAVRIMQAWAQGSLAVQTNAATA